MVAHGDRLCLLPLPCEVRAHDGVFVLGAATRIAVSADDAEWCALASFLRAELARRGTTVELHIGAAADGDVELARIDGPADAAEAYRLVVAPRRVRLEASRGAGLFYALQTFLQLLPSAGGEVPCVAISDAPRFRWRGLHLDVSRHILPVAFVKKYIDALAAHKMNVFHWHLTDDQGWRLEIRKYPRLTEVGAWRRGSSLMRDPGEGRYGGYYSQAQVREIVAYAAARYVEVVPEIDLPGHSQAAIAAYPHLGSAPAGEAVEVANRMGGSPHVYNPEEETFAFLEDVLDEVLELFPGPWVHIGGDEVDKAQWRASPRVQERMRAVGVADEGALQSYFLGRVARYLQRRGRRPIAWDEVLEGGAPGGVAVMSWRGLKGGVAAARLGRDVVMSPDTHCYFDHYQGDRQIEPPALGPPVRLRRVYDFDPQPAELDPASAARVLGGQGNLWSEFVESAEHAEYMAYPRACALAEVLWSRREARNWPDFVDRLERHLPRLAAAGIHCARSAYQVDYRVEPAAGEECFAVHLGNELGKREIRYRLDGGEPDAAAPLYTAPLVVIAPCTIRAAVFAGAERLGPVTPLRLSGRWRDDVLAARFDRAERAITVAAALDEGAERELVVGFAGSHIVFERADLEGVTGVAAEVGLAPGHTRGGAIEFRLGRRRGPLIARLEVEADPAAQGFVHLQTPLAAPAEVAAVCVCFVNEALAESELVALLASLRLLRS